MLAPPLWCRLSWPPQSRSWPRPPLILVDGRLSLGVPDPGLGDADGFRYTDVHIDASGDVRHRPGAPHTRDREEPHVALRCAAPDASGYGCPTGRGYAFTCVKKEERIDFPFNQFSTGTYLVRSRSNGRIGQPVNHPLGAPEVVIDALMVLSIDTIAPVFIVDNPDRRRTGVGSLTQHLTTSRVEGTGQAWSAQQETTA